MNSADDERERALQYFLQNDATIGGRDAREFEEDDGLGLAAGMSFALDITCLGGVLLIALILFINPENPWIWLPIVWIMLAMGLQLVFRTLANLR